MTETRETYDAGSQAGQPGEHGAALFSLAEIEAAMLAVDNKTDLMEEPISAGAWRLMVLEELAGADDDTVTIDRFTFADGSEIIIKVKGLNVEAQDDAGRAYREFLYVPLMNLEVWQDRRRKQEQADLTDRGDPQEWEAAWRQAKEQAAEFLRREGPPADD